MTNSMRDPERIDPMIEELRAFWHKHPDWRLAQIVCNAANSSEPIPSRWDPFYVEDEDLFHGLKSLHDY
jgi:hypothetical protein